MLIHPTSPAIVCGILALLAMCSAGPAGCAEEAARQWGREEGGMALSIATPKARYAPAQEPVVLDVMVENRGNEEGVVRTIGRYAHYDIKVVLPSGQDAPRTLYGKLMLGDMGSGSSAAGIPRGGHSTDSLLLNRMFDMTVDGVYKVTLTRRNVYSELQGAPFELVSNTLDVVIGKGTAAPPAAATPIH